MFAKLAILSALAAGVSAAPLPRRSFKSLDSWGGHQSLHGFDSFYGEDNYSGHIQQLNIVQHDELVCKQQEIVLVQQRLLVLQEWAKKIVTEVVCEVETQVFVWEQFHGSLGFFSDDLKRDSDFKVGYDHAIASHLPSLWDDSFEHLGFSGHDYGQNYYVPSGHNWVDETSPKSVHDAFIVTQNLKSVYHEPVRVEHPTFVPEHDQYWSPPAHATVGYYPPVHDTYYSPPPAYTAPAYYPPEHAPYYAPDVYSSVALPAVTSVIESASITASAVETSASVEATNTPQSDDALAPATTESVADAAATSAV